MIKDMGKEYDIDGTLIFEGEYINGKKNGNGKEYSFDTIRFEGEYLSGKRNGKGKKYYFNGDLEFEGKYLYSYKLYGKNYIKGKLEYEGEYLYDKKLEWKRI